MFQYSVCPNKAAYQCGDREITISETSDFSKQIVLKHNQLCSYTIKSDEYKFKLKFKQVDDMKIHVTRKYLAPPVEEEKPDQEQPDKVIQEEPQLEDNQNGSTRRLTDQKYLYEYTVVESKDQVLERNDGDVMYISVWGTNPQIDGVLDLVVIDKESLKVQEETQEAVPKDEENQDENKESPEQKEDSTKNEIRTQN